VVVGFIYNYSLLLRYLNYKQYKKGGYLVKSILPKGMKPQLNKELNAYLKLDSEIKRLTSEKNEIRKKFQAILDEFGLDKLDLTNGTLTMVKGSTRNSIADWDLLIAKLIKHKIDMELIVKQSTTKPSLRVSSH